MTGRLRNATGADGAARLDLAIDALLDDLPALLSADSSDDVELLATARLLHAALPRFHPRFGFEDRLARRLANPTGLDKAATRDAASPAPMTIGPRSATRRRGLVAGGAIASGLSLAIPLAGAALMAWRRSRPTQGMP